MIPIRYHKYGIGSLLVEWESVIDSNLITVISNCEKQLRYSFQKSIVGLVPAYNSLLVHFNYKMNTHKQIIDSISKMEIDPGVNKKSTTHNIEVDYGEKFETDLAFLSETLQLEPREIIEIHTLSVYTVHFIGFLPGFPYLSGLDQRLHCPRRPNPRIKIPAGSVAIGGQHTGIYPSSSPGGWHIIGHTNAKLIDLAKDQPCLLKSGDTIQFLPVKS